MGSGFSGVFGRRPVRGLTSVERLPKLRREVKPVLSDPYSKLLSADESVDDRVSIDMAYVLGRSGERGGSGGDAGRCGDEGSAELLRTL